MEYLFIFHLWRLINNIISYDSSDTYELRVNHENHSVSTLFGDVTRAEITSYRYLIGMVVDKKAQRVYNVLTVTASWRSAAELALFPLACDWVIRRVVAVSR